MKNELQILFEDNHLIVVNKTNSDLVQRDSTGDDALVDKLKEYIKEKYHKPGDVFLGVTHRLDRPVSGVVVFARTSKALGRMNALFHDDKIKKTYWAIVKKLPEKEEDTLVHYITRNSKQNKSYCHNSEVKDSKRAELSYKLLVSSDNYHLLEIDLKTGRHHQIRAQLATMGCPIKGDLKYGFPRSNPDGGISLHARSISFIHPVSKEDINLLANPPEGEVLWRFFLDRLG